LYTTLFTSCNAVFALIPTFVLGKGAARNLPAWSNNRLPMALSRRLRQRWGCPAMKGKWLPSADF
jgi:hypothetical protein